MWLASRAIYPAVFGKFPHIFLSTFPGYLFIARLCWPLANGRYLRARKSPAGAATPKAAAVPASARSPVASPPALAFDSPGTIVLSDPDDAVIAIRPRPAAPASPSTVLE